MKVSHKLKENFYQTVLRDKMLDNKNKDVLKMCDNTKREKILKERKL